MHPVFSPFESIEVLPFMAVANLKQIQNYVDEYCV